MPDPPAAHLSIADDTSPADWIISAVTPSTHSVTSLLPTGFPAYARMFHPASITRPCLHRPIRWSIVAGANGRVVHPAMEWASITGHWRFLSGGEQPDLWREPPLMGRLPLEQAHRLAEVLAPFTTTPDRCWFAVWDGWGFGLLPPNAPRIAMPGRPMVLFEGPLSALTTLRDDIHGDGVPAALWWPQDRAWCVATDVDLLSTYIAGSSPVCQALVDDAVLEVLPVPADQLLTWDADTINPPPDGGPDR